MTTYDSSRPIQYSPVLYITNKSASVNHSTVMFYDCPGGGGGGGHRIFSPYLIGVFNHTRFMLIPRPILEESLSPVYTSPQILRHSLEKSLLFVCLCIWPVEVPLQ
jgi:hypothetical protein